MPLGKEPAAIVSGIQTVLALLLSFHALAWLGLDSQTDLAVVMTVVSAVAALVLAYTTNATLLAPVVEVMKAGLALGAIYGLHITTEQTGLLIAVVTAVFGCWQRGQVAYLVHPTLRHLTIKQALRQRDTRLAA